MKQPCSMNNNPYLVEYSTEENVKGYIRESAGDGISYLLEKVYGPIYLKSLARMVEQGVYNDGLRILEYGCGGGMNLIHVIQTFATSGIAVKAAVGTDFSEEMIAAANREARQYLSKEQLTRVRFAVASNETLSRELAAATNVTPDSLANSFHLVMGVNTFRYCYRLKKTDECARDIAGLLVPGGTSIMIDMNKNFPFFRSRFRDRRTKPPEEYALPSLQEYSVPFERAGLRIVERTNFCWVPHSAKKAMLIMCRSLSPLLDVIFRPFAMRSLVIAVKPIQ